MSRISNYINEVRSRSEASKQRVVFFWTVFLIVVIFLIWVVSFSLSVANNNAEELRLQQEAEKMATLKAEESILATSTTKQEPIKGLIPQGLELINQGVDSVINGFWVIGNLLHK